MSSASAALLPPLEIRASLRALLAGIDRKAALREAAAKVRPAADAGFSLIEQVGGKRAEVEQFISRCFAASFGSRVEAFMPRLFSLRNEEGEICGAFGLRSGNRKLFLEQYLDAPIEEIIAARAGLRVERRAIVEVGHFSGAFPGAVRVMIGLLTERLHREGFEWVVFTGTSALRNAFSRIGLAPIDVQAASIDRLPPEERAAWGSYYDHAPRVLAGPVREGYRAMHRKGSAALAGEHR